MHFQKLMVGLLLSLAAAGSVQAQEPNTLTPQETKEGWKLLFNGRDFRGWHTYGGKGIGSAWRIDGGAMQLYVPQRVGVKAPNGGDLVTDAVISGDFEFKAEWKVEKFTNSGLFLFVQETPQYKNVHDTGLEVQVQDDAIYDGPANRKHHAGNLYGIADAGERTLKPVGEWNQLHVTLKKKKLTVLLNGATIHEHDLTSADWKARVAGSNLKDAPLSKGKFTGRIGLQDWGSGVWFRDIKLRTL